MTRQSGPARVGVIDALRGAAVVGMIAFHGAWDLHHYGFVAVDPSIAPAWRLFGDAVACCFLFLSGLGLVLARQRGATVRAAWRRLAVVGVAALAVTAVTWAVMPERVVLFGILHCLVVGNALALVLLDVPVSVPVGLGCLVAALPAVLGKPLPSEFWWLGLSPDVPSSLDVRPLLPWIAPVLFGVAAGKGLLDRPASRNAPSRWMWPFQVMGRHSLSIYLLHQPVLIASLALLTGSGLRVAGTPSAEIDGPAFLRQCETECMAAGTKVATCHSACSCAMTAALQKPSANAAVLATSCASGTQNVEPTEASELPASN